MYESFLKLRGKKVCGRETNKYFGRLSDILVNKDTNEIIGIISKNDSLLYRHRLFYMKDVSKIDEVSVYVNGFGEKFVKVIPIYSDYKSCENDIYKKKALYSDGTKMGMVQNINFNFETGKLVAFEVGASLMQDLLNGRLICPALNTVYYRVGGIVLDADKKDNFEV